MAPIRNAAVIYNEIPETYPIPGKTLVYDDSHTIDLDSVQLNGGALIKVLYLSLDPYMRGKMRDPSIKSYSPPFVIGEPLSGYGIGVVIRSENQKYKEGDHLYTGFDFREYVVLPSSIPAKVLPKDSGISWQTYLGAAGMPGKTAWLGYNAYAKPQKGETIYISTAAGAVGTLVCQLAKADGLRVIGSAGSDEKIKYLLEEIGIDAAFNYKKESPSEALKKYGPIDIFWDHVGGEGFDAAIENMNVYGRIISVGWASAYNEKDPHGGIKNIHQVLTKTISINGFIVAYLEKKAGDFDFYQRIPPLIRDGKLKIKEYVVEGLDQAGQVLLDVLKGSNDGKAILKVADQ